MDDLTKLPWAQWLEDTLQNLVKFNPVKIALVAVDEKGGTMTSYNDCTWLELFGMAGALYGDAMWTQLEANPGKLREIIENGEDDDNE